MAALARSIAAAGVQVEALRDGKLRVTGNLTDATPSANSRPQAGHSGRAGRRKRPAIGDAAVLRRRSRALSHARRRARVGISLSSPKRATRHTSPIAIRGAAVGELTIPAERYDAFALLALMQQHGHA